MPRTLRATRVACVAVLVPLIGSCSADAAGPRRPAVATVIIAPSTAEVGVGGTVPFRATVKDAGDRVLADRRVVWNTSDSAIATVSDVGVVTAKRVGTVQIAASSEAKFAIAVVGIVPTPVASVSVLPPSAQLVVGSTARLQAVTYDATGATLSGRQVTWSTSNTSVATVDAAGLVAGMAIGMATVTATSEGKTGAASVTVTVPRVASVLVAPVSSSIRVGQSAPLTATLRGPAGEVLTGRAVTWSTSNSGVATVSASGVVIGVVPGSVTITATAEGQVGSAAVTVTAGLPSRLTIVSGDAQRGTVGATLPSALVVRVADASGNPVSGVTVTWAPASGAGTTNSGTSVTDASGQASVRWTLGSKPGEQKLTATVATLGSLTFTAQATAGSVSAVTISPSTTHLNAIGETTQFSAQAVDQLRNVILDAALSWTSLNAGVASVDSRGLVTARSNGTARVVVSVSGVADTATISVQQVVAKVSVEPATFTVAVGDSKQFAASVTDANGVAVAGAQISWSSSASRVASVDQAGKATGLAVGTAMITAAAGPVAGKATLQVIVVPVSRVDVSPKSLKLEVGETRQLTARTYDAAGGELKGRPISWSSSDASVAVVDATGKVQSKKAGVATITATSEGKSDAATVTVK